MYVKIRKLNAKPTDSDVIINISKMALIEEMRKTIFEETAIPVHNQRLFYKGKQLNDDHRVMDYDIQLNDVIQLMVKQDQSVKTNGVKEPDPISESDSDKENEMNNDAEASTSEAQASNSKTNDPKEEDAISRFYKIGDAIDFLDATYGAWFEGRILKILRTENEVANRKNKEPDLIFTVKMDAKNSDGDKSGFYGDWSSIAPTAAQSQFGTIELLVVPRTKTKVDGYHFETLEAVKYVTTRFLQNILVDAFMDHTCFRMFYIKNFSELGDETFDVTFDLMRPRCYYNFKISELLVDQIVLVNYNIEQPNTRGYWYDLIIKFVNSKVLKGTILVGKDRTPLEKCTIKRVDEILRIEKPVLLDQRVDNVILPPLRKTVYYCEKCKDVASKPCKECGCKICSGKDEVDLIILCDECDYGYHTKCLTPPLESVPNDPEWYCPSCKVDENEIVKAGDKLKFSSKKSKMASAKPKNANRDWGRGMACVGRSKECTIVPKDHYGPVPGVEVGTRWKFRVQVSESGIHRPHVAGIHGRETTGAYSLVLSGGYEDDVDNGVEFIYSGSGGRDLSNNRRVNDQSSNQVLSRMNKALALNCNAPLNKDGAEAEDWKSGKPVRVVRSSKLSKHSKYAPAEGNRYDGIYKVVKYYREKGKSGYLVWKYVLRRDDPSPVPWSKDANQFDLIYPDGYTAAQAVKQKNNKANKRTQSPASSTESPEPTKKRKIETFSLDKQLTEFITNDSDNDKCWIECKETLSDGKAAFLSKVKEVFMCICCQELVHLPITTECKHNICKVCLTRSFAAKIYSCPHCRCELGEDLDFAVNNNLSKCLLQLFPGYDAGR